MVDKSKASRLAKIKKVIKAEVQRGIKTSSADVISNRILKKITGKGSITKVN